MNNPIYVSDEALYRNTGTFRTIIEVRLVGDQTIETYNYSSSAEWYSAEKVPKAGGEVEDMNAVPPPTLAERIKALYNEVIQPQVVLTFDDREVEEISRSPSLEYLQGRLRIEGGDLTYKRELVTDIRIEEKFSYSYQGEKGYSKLSDGSFLDPMPPAGTLQDLKLSLEDGETVQVYTESDQVDLTKPEIERSIKAEGVWPAPYPGDEDHVFDQGKEGEKARKRQEEESIAVYEAGIWYGREGVNRVVDTILVQKVEQGLRMKEFIAERSDTGGYLIQEYKRDETDGSFPCIHDTICKTEHALRQVESAMTRLGQNEAKIFYGGLKEGVEDYVTLKEVRYALGKEEDDEGPYGEGEGKELEGQQTLKKEIYDDIWDKIKAYIHEQFGTFLPAKYPWDREKMKDLLDTNKMKALIDAACQKEILIHEIGMMPNHDPFRIFVRGWDHGLRSKVELVVWDDGNIYLGVTDGEELAFNPAPVYTELSKFGFLV